MSTGRAADLLDRNDVESLTNFIKDPKADLVEILPPMGAPIVRDVNLGVGTVDLALTGVTNTPDGVSFEVAGLTNVVVEVRDGWLHLEVLAAFGGYAQTDRDYVELINKTFASAEGGHRRIASIRVNSDGWLEILAEPLP